MILNAALPHAPEESLQQIFINLIDEFTVWHLRILKLFQDPQKWEQQRRHDLHSMFAGSLSQILHKAYPELTDKRGLYDQIWKDLFTRGLVNTNSLHITMTGAGLMASRTTDLGNQFLKFIEAPV